MGILPPVQYTITRPFKCRWFTPLTYVLSIVFLVALIVVNVVLQGYETVTVFSPEYNYTGAHRFNDWLRTSDDRHEPCDAVVFNPGDAFVTNYGILPWKFQSKARVSNGNASLPYRGSTLDRCDVRSFVLEGDLRTIQFDVDAVMTCDEDGEFDAVAETQYSFKRLGLVANRELLRPNNTLAGLVDIIVQPAIKDLNDRVQALVQAEDQSPISLSVRIDFPPCPAALLSNASEPASCATQPPQMEVSNSALAYPNGTIRLQHSVEDDILPSEIVAPLFNLAQIVYAMVRLDIGNASPNNVFLNLSVLPTTLYSAFPSTRLLPEQGSLLYEVLARPDEVGAAALLPVSVPGPARLQVVYACRVRQQKAVGPLIAAVIVATQSMFTAVWTGYILLATCIAKQHSGANHCEKHSDLEAARPAKHRSSEEYDYHYQAIPLKVKPRGIQ